MQTVLLPIGAVILLVLSSVLVPSEKTAAAKSITLIGKDNTPIVRREDAQFYILKADEVKGPPVTWDKREGRMLVIDLAQGLRSVFDLANSGKVQHFDQAKTVRLSSQGVMIIGKLPGDGTGANRSFIISSLITNRFELRNNELLLVAEVQFKGPFVNGEPAPQSIYLSAIAQNLPVGRYQMKVQIEPRGEVYEQWKSEKSLQLPKYPPMSASFEIVEQSFSLR